MIAVVLAGAVVVSAPAACGASCGAAQDGCDAGQHGGGEREPGGAAQGEWPNGVSAGRAIQNGIRIKM